VSEIRRTNVSVVIPCYRCEETIRRAVESVALQSELPSQLILVDDHSGDGTLDSLRKLQRIYGNNWVKIICLSQNCGAAEARNAGWAAATQHYIAFLDADDSWHPQKIEIQRGWMDAHPDVVMTGHASTVEGAMVKSRPIAKPYAPAVPVSPAMLLISNRFSTPTIMLRREITHRFDGSKRRGEDYLLWLEIILSKNKVARFPMNLAYIHKARFGAGGLSGDLFLMQIGEIDVYRKLLSTGLLGRGGYALLWLSSWAKYVRRVVVSKLAD